MMYAPEDEAVKIALDVQLNPIKRTELIETWGESQVPPGTEKDREIAARIEAADIVLLLVTANFFGYDHIFDHQLRVALKRHLDKKTVIIPILMRSCIWTGTPIEDLKATILPRDLIAFDKHDSPDLALVDTVQQLNGWCKKIFDRKNNAR